MQETNMTEEDRKEVLLKKITKASENFKTVKNNKILDDHMSVLRNREDPYIHIGQNKLNKRNRRIFVLLLVGIFSLFLLLGVVLHQRNVKILQ